MTGFSLSQALACLMELNDLKRVVSAGRAGSIATRLFGEAWDALMGGAPALEVAGFIVGRALAAARLGDIDRAVLVGAGVPDVEAHRIQLAAIETIGADLPTPVLALVRSTLDGPDGRAGERPGFVAALAQQPRAGLTCPGKPRIVLEPPENHAEHCLTVAVYGVLLSAHYEADPGRVFLAGLAHHFHNAGMPDAGFTGEMLLGPHLGTVMAHHTAACLGQLPPGLRATVERARAILPDAHTAEGRAFHAADVLDRVLQLNQYLRAAALTPAKMLGEMELVHAGPVKGFQDEVLRQAGLL